MYHKQGGITSVTIPSAGKYLQNDRNNSIDGILLIDGGKSLLISLTETKLHYSRTNKLFGGACTKDGSVAITDFNGKDNTSLHIQDAECSSPEFAPGFCAEYSRTNEAGYGVGKGKWWLPSLGELMLISANMDKINHALSYIDEAQKLGKTFYWSSTQYDSRYMWNLTMGGGQISAVAFYGKAEEKGFYMVRPVSTLQANI